MRGGTRIERILCTLRKLIAYRRELRARIAARRCVSDTIITLLRQLPFDETRKCSAGTTSIVLVRIHAARVRHSHRARLKNYARE